MALRPNVMLIDLLNNYPGVDEVLGWYGIELDDDADLTLTLAEACGEHSLDIEDVMVDLEAVLDSDDDDDGDDDDDDGDWEPEW